MLIVIAAITSIIPLLVFARLPLEVRTDEQTGTSATTLPALLRAIDMLAALLAMLPIPLAALLAMLAILLVIALLAMLAILLVIAAGCSSA